MNLKDLRAFVAVAEEQSFTKAARRLFTSQPPLTRQIRELEEELGVTLFVRSKQGAQLTTEGTVLAERADMILAQAADFMNLARSLQNRDSGVVRIGIAWRLWEIVNRVRDQHARRFPAVSLEGHDIYSSFQIEALLHRTIDVGFLRPPVESTYLHAEVILHEHFVVLLSEHDPLAKQATLRIEDIADKPLLLYNRAASMGLYDRILSFYANAGLSPTIVHTTVGPAQEAGLLPIASGKAIFLTTSNELTGLNYGSGVIAVPLDVSDATVGVAIAWRKDERSHSVLRFVDCARRVFTPLERLS